MEEWDFEYVGELIDPEQSPLTMSVYACKRCGALVTSATEIRHQAACDPRNEES